MFGLSLLLTIIFYNYCRQLDPLLALIWFLSFLTREYAKLNERVIGDDGKFTDSLTDSLTYSLTHSLTQILTYSNTH